MTADVSCVQLVPVLPVVMKADTMTMKERINFRADLNQRLLHPKPNCDESINLFAFSEEVLAEVGISDGNLVRTVSMPPPYLVVCSNTCNKEQLAAEEPQFWPERNYDWGICEAFNPEHSDLLLLRRLLLQEGVEEIARDKVKRFASQLHKS
jgi:septin family protein